MLRTVMMTFHQVEQIASWVVRKYIRFLLLGAVSACAMLNLALHAGAGLQYYCEGECLLNSLKAPVASLDKSAIMHIRNHWTDPPAPKGSYKADFPLENPPWLTLGNWGDAYKFINSYFKKYEKPGTFMEIGAQDGEFMSLTLFLEKELGFQGLLVEPNPLDYRKLREAKRSSFSINACATPEAGHKKDLLWLRDTPDNLPPLLHRIQEGSNRLLQYVSTEDRELGQTVEVQCFNAGAMAVAALNTLTIDLLTISTHGGELDILMSIPLRVRFRMIVLLVPLATEEEWSEVKKLADSRGLVSVFDKYNVHILIPKSEVKVV
ncbi:uncharacterized protein LOC135217015 [Macrobrachium nipponense]|uniref:uncharacterized protein LOC135217015 n=1 Tax=Macrobrachium nipponense TaxID=159736 RepID=UPI0030C893D0